jgi:hypothetical protein
MEVSVIIYSTILVALLVLAILVCAMPMDAQ